MGAGCKKSAVGVRGFPYVETQSAFADDIRRLRAHANALTLACHLEDDPPVEPGVQESNP